MEKRNIQSIVDNGLCMGCGLCQDACPKGCIKITHRNTNYPLVDETKCVLCGRCYATCPGKGIKLVSEGKNLYPNAKFNKYIGRYESLYTGHSLNEDIRLHSASGGVVTQFLCYLFDKHIIDGAAVVGQQDNSKMLPKAFVAKSKEEVISAKSSKYVVTSYEGIAKKLINGKFVIVGLPCHIQAFRQYTKIDRKFRESVIGIFSIFCSLNKTKLSTEYYLYRYGIEAKNLGTFAYRDNGCPGYMTFTNRDGKVIKQVPYLDFWMGTHNFFQNKRCSFCFDQFGELADINFGDINIRPYNEDKVGVSSVVVRSKKWNELFQEAVQDGYLSLEPLSKEDLLRSQRYVMSYKKGRGIAATLQLRKMFGKKNPINDEDLPKPGIKDYLKQTANFIMRQIGKKKSSFQIVKLLDFKK